MRTAEQKKTELLGLAESLRFEGIDCDLEVSLFEYGMIMNHDGEIIYALISPDNDDVIGYDYTSVSGSDINDALEDATEGFYSFIGADKATVMNSESNFYDNISYIHSLNDYSGTFEDTMTYQYNVDDMIVHLKEIKQGYLSRGLDILNNNQPTTEV